jgi:hypothetical protein
MYTLTKRKKKKYKRDLWNNGTKQLCKILNKVGVGVGLEQLVVMSACRCLLKDGRHTEGKLI